MMLKQLKNYFLAGVLFIAGIGLGFLLGRNYQITPTVMETAKNDSVLYSSQTAFIRGKINEINGRNLSVININNNATGEVVVSDKVVIIKPGKNASPSSDLATIETGKEVLINLQLVNGQYEAVTIQYITPAPTLPPLQKPAAQNANP